MERELHAVDSEHRKNLSSDAWKLMQLGKSLSNPEHPNSKFSTGNYDILYEAPTRRGAHPRELLMNFHDKHYSANLMKLAILGTQPLEEL